MSTGNSDLAARIDMTKPHPARRYDYWLGGKDNFQADRDAAEAIAAVFPHIRTAARENRAFMQRAVRFLAAEAGIRQFLDIGTGLPTADNVHDVAQRIAPESRIVYVDNDPLVLVHARALLTSSPQGATAYIDADARTPDRILANPALRNTLDFSQPVALLLVALLHFVEDNENPYDIVRELVAALPAGSYLVLSHATFDPLDPDTIAAMNGVNRGIKPMFCPRPLADVSRFFDGLDLLKPGIVSVSDWRPQPGPRPTPAEATGYGAVARKIR
ncbi:SAM-dependent methyltransferase [Actinoplanes sp. NEAU-A12]|uniref:SAM-dependent methyltransferase n=1 Tax=Actinoplanes sandaracinus TaxID=3045177 RepID=A0ABT6WBX2_9ACTN|nr:SAM-dependent methyltransferase [Actinoplanes sandaracinus]MDI6097218.1 SAM-dependent methyltransferase [Actinoplanes sandaracinus]